jgi:hypothetical protein
MLLFVDVKVLDKIQNYNKNRRNSEEQRKLDYLLAKNKNYNCSEGK